MGISITSVFKYTATEIKNEGGRIVMRPVGQVVPPSCFSLSKHAGLFRSGGGRFFGLGVGVGGWLFELVGWRSLWPWGMGMSWLPAVLSNTKTENRMHALTGSRQFLNALAKNMVARFWGIFKHLIESRDLMITGQESPVVSKSPE